MNTVELFAGAGGAAVGLERAGCHHLACVERDSVACATLRAAGLPAVERDVAEWLADPSTSTIRGLGLLWASPPCQPYSKAGKGLGAGDPRDCWPLVVQAAQQLGPRWVIVENVRGCPADEWARQLREAGYAWAGWRLFNAADYGLPQHRRRVFVVAGPYPIRWPRPTHADPYLLTPLSRMMRPDLKPWVSCRDALGLDVGALSTHPEEGKSTGERRVRDLSDRPSMCLGTYSGGVNRGGQPFVIVPGNGGNAPAPRSVQEPAHTVTASTPMYLAPSPTITTAESQGVGSAHARGVIEQQVGRRKLTPAECATLQGFPTDHPFQGGKGAQYRQIGNAVPPIMAELLGRAVMAAELLEVQRDPQ